MEDFISKKEKLIDLLAQYMQDKNVKVALLEYVKELEEDSEFKNDELFKSLFKDINSYLSELSNKEIKQRISILKTYLP